MRARVKGDIMEWEKWFLEGTRHTSDDFLERVDRRSLRFVWEPTFFKHSSDCGQSGGGNALSNAAGSSIKNWPRGSGGPAFPQKSGGLGADGGQRQLLYRQSLRHRK